jgi:transposase
MGYLESNAVAFTACIRRHVVRSIEIEQGMAALERYRAAGLITFTEDRRAEVAERFKLDEPRPAPRDAQRAAAAKMAADLVALMEGSKINLKRAAEQMGCNYSTAIGWVRKFENYNPQLNAEKLARAIRLINEESHSMTTAAHTVGCSLGSLSNYLRKSGYRYDRETCRVSRRDSG